MREPAGGEFRYRRYVGDTIEKARAQARDDVAALAQHGWRPCAERWDDRIGSLVLAFRASGADADGMPPGEEWAPFEASAGGTAGKWKRPVLVGIGGLLVIALLAVGSGRLASTPDTDSASPSPRRASASVEAGQVPRIEPVECRAEWMGWADCGDLIVLEDRAKPDGPRIRIHFARVPAYGESSEPDPIVYLAGGPGDSPLINGIWYVEQVLAADRDLIVLDQRGMGLSEPSLACTSAVGALPWWDLDALDRCRQRLVREGANLAAYNTTASAADVEDLRTALGYESWNLYGVSYGSRLALAVMREHPESVRSAILDSVYPVGVDALWEAAPNAQRAFDELFAGCAADADCAAAYPDVEKHFYLLVERLNSLPKRVDLGGYLDIEVDGSTLMWVVFDRMYVTEYLPSLPATLDRFWDGDWDELDGWLEEGLLGGTGLSRRASLNIGAYHSIECAETVPFAGSAEIDMQAGVRPAVVDAFDPLLSVDRCAVWDVPAAADAFHEPIHSDIPTLLLAGTYDPVTPPAWAARAAETLANSSLVIAPGVGHGVVGSSACVDGIVERFLERPSQPPATACVNSLPPPLFEAP